MEELDVISLVSKVLNPLKVPIIEGWYDEELKKTHITVHEYLDTETWDSDDETGAVIHNIQVDIWSTNSLEAYNLKKKIKKRLKENEFRYESGQDFYEVDTQIYHKAMRFNCLEVL